VLYFRAVSAPTSPAILAVLVGLLAASLLTRAGARLDDALFLAINARHLPAPLEMAVRLTSHLGLLPTNGLIWAGLAWASRTAPGERRAQVIFGAVGLVAAWLASRALKAATNRTRPYLAVEGARLVGLAPSLSSFPSSHAALAVYSAVTIPRVLEWGAGRTALAWLLAAVVCYARVYLGAHYPRDVLAGATIGLVAAAAAAWRDAQPGLIGGP